MKKKINNKGFTLIELLAIIAITAIILGVGTYGIVNLVNKSKEKGSLISETSIKGSASLYADEAGDSLWIDPGSGDYKYYCVTIEELINKGIIKKNAKLPKGIGKYNYVSIKKNKVTFVKNDPVILDSNADINSTDYQVCTGNKFEEDVSKFPEFTGNKSWTDSLEVSFNDGKAESDIKDKWCQYDTVSSISGDKNIIVLDSKTNTCNIDKNLTNKTSYYVRVCMSTVRGSTMCSGTNSYSTADFINPEFSTKDDTITIKYKDDNVKEPYHYFKSNVNGTSDKNVSECTLGSDNKFTCSGSTSNITKDKWYKVNENEVKITYKDNEIKNGDITARIMDKTGNYKDNDKKFNLYRTVFKKGNADKINNSTNDITNICLNDIDKKCNIKSPSISKKGYTIVGWNTDSSASSSIWKANTSKNIDGSNTYYPIIKSRVNIKLNANGGSVTKETSKGGTYTTDYSGIISRNGKDIFHKINYGDKMNSSGLANYNNKDYLYITKRGFTTIKNQEWICLSGCSTNNKVYSQYEAYSSDDFCDAKDVSCTVVLGVNWVAENYTLTYDNNGGSGCSSKAMAYGKEYGNLCTPSRRGYAFVGWFDSNYKDSPLNYYADTYSDLKNAFGYDANLLYKHYFEYGLKEGRRISQYMSTDKYNTDGNKTIYAGWKNVVYKINYNANGGTGTMESDNAGFGTNVTIKNNGFSREGYTFVGWTTKSNGTDDGYGWTGWSGTWNYVDGQYGIAENKLELYAMWKKNSVHVKLNANGGNVTSSTNGGKYTVDSSGIISWNGNNIFHTIGYGDKMNSDGLANYNNKDYLYITRSGYSVIDNQEWICLSGCSTSNKVYSQASQYSSNDFCNALNGDCTVVLGVNWKNVYTISYDANGGRNVPSNQTKIYGQSITLSSSKPIRIGYTFTGWNTSSDGSGTSYSVGATYSNNANVTLYAQWKINKVYIKLNANGGTVTTNTSKGGTYTVDSSGIISWNGNNIFHNINYGNKMNSSGLANYNNKDYLYITKRGFTTIKNQEWICLSGCSTNNKVYSQYEAYSSNDFCDTSNSDCTVVLGVNWKKDSYTISYGANGGSGSMTSDTVSIGDTVTIKNNTFTKTGYTFTGWTTKSDGTDDGYGWTGWSGTWNYDNGQYGINNNKLVLYARWTSNKYTISYNANGGSNAPSNQSKTYGNNISLSSSKPIRTGYTFIGWNTSSNGSGTSYSAGATYSNNANVTLYAQWRINKVYIKLDANGGSVRGSTTYGSCRTNNNLIGCSWNSPKELFHTIDYGDSLDSAGLANYNNSDYLYITKDGYFAYASETWICDSSSGCSTVGRTFDQDTAYKASDFCDASNGDCTVTLKVNWKAINKTINDWRCHDKYSYFITYCEPNYMCEYTRIAYKENGKSYVKYVNGKIDSSTSLNLSSCFVDNIDDYRCNSNGKYKITTCSVTTCIYTELNGNTMNPNNLYIVDRDTLKECAPDTKTMYVTSSNGVNCRYGAGTSYGIAVAYSCGAALTVNVNTTNGWYYVTNDECYSIGSALSSSKPSSCSSFSGGGTSGGCKKIVKCITSAGSDAQCRSKISSLGGSYAGYNGKGDCIGNFCRSSCPSGSVETGGFY